MKERYSEIYDQLDKLFENDATKIEEYITKIVKQAKKFNRDLAKRKVNMQNAKNVIIIKFFKDVFEPTTYELLTSITTNGKIKVKKRSITEGIKKIKDYNINKDSISVYRLNEIQLELKNKNYTEAERIKARKKYNNEIKKDLIAIEIWKNDTGAYICESPIWEFMSIEERIRGIGYDILVLDAIQDDIKDKMEVELEAKKIRSNDKYILSLALQDKIDPGNKLKASDDEEGVANALISAKNVEAEMKINEKQSVYYHEDVTEKGSISYLFVANKEDGGPKVLNRLDKAVIDAVVRMTGDRIFNGYALNCPLFELAKEVYGTDIIYTRDYEAIINSIGKMSTMTGIVKNSEGKATNYFHIMEGRFTYNKPGMNQENKEYFVSKDGINVDIGYRGVFVEVGFSRWYIERLKKAVFITADMRDLLACSSYTSVLLPHLQEFRYEWYKTHKSDETIVTLSYNDFFKKFLYLRMSGKGMYRDRDNIKAALEEIVESKTIISELIEVVRFDYKIKLNPMSDQEKEYVQSALESYGSRLVLMETQAINNKLDTQI